MPALPPGAIFQSASSSKSPNWSLVTRSLLLPSLVSTPSTTFHSGGTSCDLYPRHALVSLPSNSARQPAGAGAPGARDGQARTTSRPTTAFASRLIGVSSGMSPPPEPMGRTFRRSTAGAARAEVGVPIESVNAQRQPRADARSHHAVGGARGLVTPARERHHHEVAVRGVEADGDHGIVQAAVRAHHGIELQLALLAHAAGQVV